MDKTEQILRKIIAENTFMQFLGIEFLEIKQGYAVARIKYKKELTNPYGTLHGGSLYSLADIAAGTAACMSGYYVTTVAGNLNFMLPAEGTEYIYCEAVQLRLGKHLAVFEVKLKDDEEKLLDSGEFTFFVTEQKVLA
ncbi:MAG: PaaI family thioesterase [Suilimivivens sp.]